MNNGITRENLLWTLPAALQQDEDKRAVATVVADELTTLYKDNRLLALYTRIDELDEALLDILAKDFSVSWYLYDGTVNSKRAQIKSCFYVHRRLGTKSAMITALSDLCPGSDVFEWFEYGGEPYHFRVLLDVTEQRTPIKQSVVETYINIFKSLRSILENDEIIYRSRNTVAVGVSGQYVFYTARLCGTFPEAAVQGRIQQDVIIVSADGDSVAYTVPATGEIKTGTFPITAVQGGIENGDISMGTSVGSASYNSRMCGTPLGSLI